MNKLKIIDKKDFMYPKKLLEIKNPPDKIYVLGNINLLRKKIIAIVGSRKCSQYGYNQAINFSKELSKNDICIVSGMAIGIDSAAHIGALSEKGKTIAVLGGGFNNIVPKENEILFNKIILEGGCIISEYKPEEESKSENFPVRNRIISGLSDGVLIVEAAERSGSTLTAGIAKRQKKNIYCIPGNIDNKLSHGTGRLIQQKDAKLVLTSNDILEDLGIKTNIKEEKIQDDIKLMVIDKKYIPIYNLVKNGPININTICKKSGKNIGEVNIAITMLELQGIIKEIGINEYILKE